MKIRSGFISKLGLLAIASIVIIIGAFYLAIAIRPDARTDVDSQNLIRVYSAAGAVKPVRELIHHYNAQNEFEVRIIRIGGSGELAGQIKIEFETGLKDRADLFVTNDDLILNDADYADLFASKIQLAQQKPVIAVAKENKVKLNGIKSLVSGNRIRFGIASEHAAIGKLTRTIASQHAVLEMLERQKVLDAENVMILGQALLTGSLDAAIVWDTTVLQINRTNGSEVLAVASLADLNDQANSGTAIGVINSGSATQANAESFARFLATSKTARDVFEKHGFQFAASSTSDLKAKLK